MPERTVTARKAVLVHVFVQPADIGNDAAALLAHAMRWKNAAASRYLRYRISRVVTPFLGPVGPMLHAGRPAGVHSLGEILVAIPLAAFDDVDLLPEVVHERLGASAAGIDLQHPRDEHPVRIVGEDFLVVPRRRSLDRHPRQVGDREKLQLGLWHYLSSNRSAKISLAGVLKSSRSFSHSIGSVVDVEAPRQVCLSTLAFRDIASLSTQTSSASGSSNASPISFHMTFEGRLGFDGR